MNESAGLESIEKKMSFAHRANAESTMCEKCKELDEKIAHTRRLAKAGFDDLTLDRFATLIEEYERRKKVIHPDV